MEKEDEGMGSRNTPQNIKDAAKITLQAFIWDNLAVNGQVYIADLVGGAREPPLKDELLTLYTQMITYVRPERINLPTSDGCGWNYLFAEMTDSPPLSCVTTDSETHSSVLEFSKFFPRES